MRNHPDDSPTAQPKQPPLGRVLDLVAALDAARTPGGNLIAPRSRSELDWQERATCAETDPEAFFPDKGCSTRDAKQICMSCPVRAQCLRYALDNDEAFGVFGGMTPHERKRFQAAGLPVEQADAFLSSGSASGAQRAC